MTTTPTAAKIPPRTLVERRLRSKDCTLPPRARSVALALCTYLDPAGTAWPSVAGLAVMTGLCRRTVQSALGELCDGSAPLFARSWPESTRGRAHRTPRYSVVLSPERFAAKRDQSRAARATKASTAADAATREHAIRLVADGMPLPEAVVARERFRAAAYRTALRTPEARP